MGSISNLFGAKTLNVKNTRPSVYVEGPHQFNIFLGVNAMFCI